MLSTQSQSVQLWGRSSLLSARETASIAFWQRSRPKGNGFRAARPAFTGEPQNVRRLIFEGEGESENGLLNWQQ
jgi:hypothetical protein